jgi:hypothetical protein
MLVVQIFTWVDVIEALVDLVELLVVLPSLLSWLIASRGSAAGACS